jgi:hypothetical protein
MPAAVVAIDGELARCVGGYAYNRRCLLELLRFIGKHPYTRFSRLAIVHALKNQGVLVEMGLKYLVDTGLVITETENNIRLYSLTRAELTRNWALELVRLDWYQWQSLLRQIDDTD